MQDQQGVDLKALRARTATITMRGGIVATGTVTDPQGKPIAGAVVVRGDHPYWEVGSQEVRTDEQGRYRLPPLPFRESDGHGDRPGLDARPDEGRDPQGDGPGRFSTPAGQGPANSLRRPVGEADRGCRRQDRQMARRRVALQPPSIPNVLDTQHSRSRPTTAASTTGRWAPDDAVTYQFYKEGYVRHEATLIASGSEQTVTLAEAPADLREGHRRRAGRSRA